MQVENKKVKFVYNGIRIWKTLYKWYWACHFDAKNNPYVMFIHDEYANLPKEIVEYVGVKIQNDTNSMTDYFCKDSFVLKIWDKKFIEGLAACIKKEEKHFVTVQKRKFGIESGRESYLQNLKKEIELMISIMKWLLLSN